MKIRQGIASFFCLFGLTLCNGGLALAEMNTDSVRRISIAEATGQTGVQPPLIQLSPGYGVSISFIPTGEIVQKVWFDNPSFATLDADGCLSGLGGGQSGHSKECQPNGATVLHLRRINPLNMPGLPKTNSSLLTVITSGSTSRRVYLFWVAQGGSTPQYQTIEVTPVSTAINGRDAQKGRGGDAQKGRRPDAQTIQLGFQSPIELEPLKSWEFKPLGLIAPDTGLETLLAPRQSVRASERHLVDSVSDWQTLHCGLTVAEQQRLIRRNQPLWNRIQNLLAKVKAGEHLESAAHSSGISLDLVKRLQELGSREWGVGSGEWGVGSGEWGVGSGEFQGWQRGERGPGTHGERKLPL